MVLKECWSLSYSVLDAVRYFVWVSLRYCSELDKAVKEISYLEEELDWKVYFYSVKTALA